MEIVKVCDVMKSYGSSHDRKVVLNKLNMTVTSGSIYGIIGASGCGKTTLLSCILGIVKADEGGISVLGENVVDDKVISVGRRIGYMPQETALVGELSIRETLYYFGNIFQMSKNELDARYEMLLNLLELPDQHRKVQKLSGGQQRRVSFAVALIHNPDLLILDEPTVGLDPILREKIWNFMLNVTRTSRVAIIITTHYIEEARQADRCGLMRNGILLAEDAPRTIIEKHQCENLEEAFLRLCLIQEKRNQEFPVHLKHKKLKSHKPIKDAPIECKYDASFLERKRFDKQTLKAIMYKIFIQLVRQPVGIFSVLLIPALSALIFYLAVGGNPKGLKIGIINDEMANINDCSNRSLITHFVHDYSCDLQLTSCRFINEINQDIGEKIFYKNSKDAFKDAKQGKLIAVIHIASNYTKYMQDNLSRNENDDKDDDSKFENREISVHVDQSNRQISFFFQKKLMDSYSSYSKKLMHDCQVPEKYLNLPIDFRNPIYGQFDGNFRDSMGPSMVTIIGFFASSALALSILTDRKEGFWNRTLLAGVEVSEILLSYLIILSLFFLVQLLQLIMLVYFLAPNTMNILPIIFQIILLGYCGIWHGLFLSCLFDDLVELNLFFTSMGQISMTLAGIFWPLEGMPKFIYYLSHMLPATLPSIGIKNILFRGAGPLHSSVLNGYLITIVWAVFFIICTILTLRRKKFSRNSTKS